MFNIEKEKLFKFALILQAITSGIVLTLYAYLGKFTRLLADDYYHSALLHTGKGIIELSVEKYLHVSNRYTNMFLFAFGDWIGIHWFSAILIILWVVGLNWLLIESNKLLGGKISKLALFSISALLIFLSILQAPNRYQTIYWISGMVTYFSPIVFFTYILAGIFAFLRKQRSKIALLFAALLSVFAMFFIGGLSETVGALHIAILFLIMFAFWLFGKEYDRQSVLILFGAALLGGFISLGFMAFTPANAIRSDAPPIEILIFLRRLIIFPSEFIIDTLKTLPLPSFFTVIIGYLIANEISLARGRKIFRWALALIPLLIFVLIAASFAPSAYALSFPDERVRFPARVVMTSGLFAFGAFFALIFAREKESILPTLLLVAASLYPLRGAWQAYQTIPEFQTYADAWDTREAYILSKKESGMMNISLPPLDGMGGVKEFDIEAKHWVNQAAAQYYGVDAISVHSTSLDYEE